MLIKVIIILVFLTLVLGAGTMLILGEEIIETVRGMI